MDAARKTRAVPLRAALVLSAMALGGAICILPQAARSEFPEINGALQAGQADKALSALQQLPEHEADSAEAHNLRCRVFYTLEMWSAATSECEKAVNLDGQDSMSHLWLGRTLGELADKSSFVSAYGLAKRARAEFEQAAQLDPHNAEALADLGEFYSSAPGVVGGGTEKATAVAARLDRLDPVRAHELRAAVAQENRDFATAEQELKLAIAATPHPASQWMRLASFYRRNKRWEEMESAVRSGAAAAARDKHAGVALFNGAAVLMKANRNPALAVKLLETYLANSNETEEAPAFAAHVRLAKLKAQLGDQAGARQERSEALALANEYKPAQELKF